MVTESNLSTETINFTITLLQILLTLYIRGYFYTVFVPGGGKFAPSSKNRLVSDRSKIFCMLKVFFVKFLKIKILRF